MMGSIASASLVALTISFAQAGDLDTFREREQLLAQKWSREVATALDTSRRLERNDPAAAREALQVALNQLKSAAGLSETLRGDLTRRLQARMGDLTAAAPPAKTATAPSRPSGYATGGFVGPASPPSATPPPGSTAATARSFYEKQNAALAKSNETKDNRTAGYSGAIAGVQNSAVPTDKEMSLAKDHGAIAARRAPVVNAKEDAVIQALASTVDGDFSGMTFRQALDLIIQKSGLVIIPDANSLKEANVEYDDPVNFKIPAKISVRTALRKMLGDRGLAYTINEGVVNVVTTQRAREATVVRIYPVNDLVTPIQPQPQFIIGPYGNLIPVAAGTFPAGTPGVTPSFKQQAGQMIVDMVRTSVDPNYWAPNGPGTVTFSEATGSLVVRANAETHFLIGGALRSR